MVPTREELHAKLKKFLLERFDAGELRMFLHYLPGGTELVRQLPGPTATPNETVTAAVKALDSLDYLPGAEFWDRLAAERPRRSREIEELRSAFKDPLVGGEGGAGRPGQDQLVILLASASPIRTPRALEVDEEFARIVDRLQHRRNLRIEQRTALTFGRLQAALNELNPNILHISSHGEPGALFFKSPRGDDELQRVPKESLVQLITALNADLRLVILNACDSLEIAEALVDDAEAPLDWAIGMQEPIFDVDAIEYSVSLYDSIAAGRAIGPAHKAALACLALSAGSTHIPRLVPADPARAGSYTLTKPPARR